MIIDCISDLHGFLPQTEGGDLLIVAGDLTATDHPAEYLKFFIWLHQQNYRRYIIIAGNHDNEIQKQPDLLCFMKDTDYLQDSGCEFEGLKIWGSPWTQTFIGMNPKCKAFTLDTEEELAEKYQIIPKDTNILITHNPSFGNLDTVKAYKNIRGSPASVGSMSLWLMCLTCMPHLKLHVFGHVHESYGHVKHYNGIELVNASYVNENYQPVNKPIRIIL